jgi:hypothetical protein
MSKQSHRCLIQRSAWKRNSANFAVTEFSEVRLQKESIHREFIVTC